MQNISLSSFDDTSVAFSYKTDWQLRKSHILFSVVKRPSMAKIATSLVKAALFLQLPVKPIIKRTVFEHFCGGETIDDCRRTIDVLGKFHVGTILDYSVEGGTMENEFDQTAAEIANTIRTCSKSENIPFAVFKVSGIANVDILEKVQSGQSLSQDEQTSFDRAHARIESLCKEAADLRVRVFVDAEDSWYQGTIDNIVYDMMARYNSQQAFIYNTFQMYRIDMYKKLMYAIEKARSGGYNLGAKLVRGAYMEKERDRAEEMGYEDPIHPDKAATDRAYDEALKLCVEHLDVVSLANCTHNEKSNLLLTQLVAERRLDRSDPRIYFGQLYGMSDNISFNLSKAGYNVAKYVPYGPVRSVMPYLFRRAAENTSVAGQSSRELGLIEAELRRRRTSAKS